MKIRNALRSYGIISTVLPCMIGFVLLHLGRRDLAFSEKESHVLQQRPVADMAAIFHDSFQKESGTWLRNQFNRRFAPVQLHASLNYILGRRELQDVIIGQDDILFQKQGKPNQERLQIEVGQLRSFVKRHGDKKLPMLFVPSKSTIWKEKLPVYEQGEDRLETLKGFHEKLPAAITWIDAAAPLWQHRGEMLYYASDHRWTARGATVTFDTRCTAEKRKRKTDYGVYTVNGQFYGTLTNASGYYRGKKDHVDIYVPEKSQELVITYIQEQRRTATVFERNKAAPISPYDVFFDGDRGLMQLDTAQSGKRLLVIKDSYANCFLPFLIPYYKNITVADPRYYYDDLDRLIKEQGIQEIPFLCNADTFFSDNSLNEILKREVEQKRVPKQRQVQYVIAVGG